MGWIECDHTDIQDGLWWKDATGCHYWPADFQPTIHLQDAWQLIRHLNARGWMVNIDANPDGSGAASVLKQTGPDEWSCIGISKAGSAVELAICQAALRAMEHEVKE